MSAWPAQSVPPTQTHTQTQTHTHTPRPGHRRTGRGEATASDAFTWARSRAFRRSSLGGSSSGGAGAELAFWPLPEGLGSGETLTLELRGDPAGIVADSQVGRAALPLGPLAARYPRLLEGEAVRLQVALTSPAAQKAAAAAAAGGEGKLASAGSGSGGGASNGGEGKLASAGSGGSGGGEAGAAAASNGSARGERALGVALQLGRPLPPEEADSEDEGEAGEAGGIGAASLAAVLAAQAADGSSLSPPGSTAGATTGATAGTTAGTAEGPVLDVELRLEPVSCLDALAAVGLPPAAAQTCLAMLAEPGGLYLDVKSAYSTPRDLMVRAWQGGRGSSTYLLRAVLCSEIGRGVGGGGAGWGQQPAAAPRRAGWLRSFGKTLNLKHSAGLRAQRRSRPPSGARAVHGGGHCWARQRHGSMGGPPRGAATDMLHAPCAALRHPTRQGKGARCCDGPRQHCKAALPSLCRCL